MRKEELAAISLTRSGDPKVLLTTDPTLKYSTKTSSAQWQMFKEHCEEHGIRGMKELKQQPGPFTEMLKDNTWKTKMKKYMNNQRNRPNKRAQKTATPAIHE